MSDQGRGSWVKVQSIVRTCNRARWLPDATAAAPAPTPPILALVRARDGHTERNLPTQTVYEKNIY
jgi:hypothetical protein